MDTVRGTSSEGPARRMDKTPGAGAVTTAEENADVIILGTGAPGKESADGAHMHAAQSALSADVSRDFNAIGNASLRPGGVQVKKVRVLGTGEFGIVFEGKSLIQLLEVRNAMGLGRRGVLGV